MTIKWSTLLLFNDLLVVNYGDTQEEADAKHNENL